MYAPPQYDRKAWGWARTLPDLEELLAAAKRAADSQEREKHKNGGTAVLEGASRHARSQLFMQELGSSRAYQSPHCATALSEASQLHGVFEGMAGSVVAMQPSEEAVETLRGVGVHAEARACCAACLTGAQCPADAHGSSASAAL